LRRSSSAANIVIVARRVRGKTAVPRASAQPAPVPPPAPIAAPPPKRHDESVTARLEMTPEILASMLIDDSERPTVRMPARPPFASAEDEELARLQKTTDATVRKRVVIGPDGEPRMFDEDEFEESTRVGAPPKALLDRVRAAKKKTKR
jgi:hypothetical protein